MIALEWARRTRELHDELAAIADLASLGPTWWLLAGSAAAAEPLPARARYVISDAEPDGDTFIGHRSPPPSDPLLDALARAHAARLALRELDGHLPEQPLAVTISRGEHGASVIPSALDIAAFAIGDTVVFARLSDRIEDDGPVLAQLVEVVDRAAILARTPRMHFDPTTADEHGRRFDTTLVDRTARDLDVRDAPTPFVCVSIGEDRLTVARHGHRRAWHHGTGPWLGLGRVGELATTSTCHMVVDGYGHAWLAARIAEHHTTLIARAIASASVPAPVSASKSRPWPAPPPAASSTSTEPTPIPQAASAIPELLTDTPISASVVAMLAASMGRARNEDLPHLSLVAGAIPLGVAWRELKSPAPRALELAYALGCVLHRVAGKPDARFSPTFQIPIAPGAPDDADRHKRRVVPSTISVRFDRGKPEPFAEFAARTREILTREAQGRGLCSRLLTAARAVPVPLAFKRRSFTSARSGMFDRIAEVVGGRACLSKIRMSSPVPLSCAVSSPARLATKADRVGGCVLTIIDDGERAAITACGSGLAGSGDDAADLIDAVLALTRTIA